MELASASKNDSVHCEGSIKHEDELRELQLRWMKEQIENAKLVDCSENPAIRMSDDGNMLNHSGITLVGGLDISYPTWSDTVACGCLVVYNPQTKSIVYQNIIDDVVTMPYIPGYLAYRELPVFQKLIHALRQENPDMMPQILLVDGNGTNHPNHFGSACTIGLDIDIPTIGVSKNPFCGEIFRRQDADPVPLTEENAFDACWDLPDVRKRLGDCTKIMHYGECIGMTVCKEGTTKPIYVSVGHKLSLQQAVSIVKELSVYRVPEPIRFADHLSRRHLEQLKSQL